MTDQQLLAEFEALAADEKIILALLALIGEATGRTAILDLLNKAGVRDARGFMFNVNTLDEPLLKLERLAFVSVLTARGYMCNTKLRWPAIRAAIGAHVLGDLCAAHDALHPMRQGWNGAPEPRSYRQGVARLRMALLRGQAPQQVLPLLQACMACYEAAQLHPIVDIFTRPFEPGMLILVHPLLLDDVLMLLLQHCQREPSLAPGVRGFTERHCQRRIAKNEYISDALRLALAEDAILCGELKQGATWLEGMDGSLAQFFRSVIVLLRGDSENALDNSLEKSLAGFEGALKTLRRDTGKRKMLFRGMGGHLYVLALLRSADPKMQKAAESYLELAVHTQANPDSTVYQQLSMLRQIRAGTMQTDVVLSRAWETGMQPQMFQALLWFWLSLPQLGDKREPLHALAQQAETLGYKFIAAQAASLLGHLGDADMATHAAALRERLGFADLTGWFERQEAWQRQLTALINLQQAAPDAAGGETRLVWMITYDPRHGVTEIEPREQKRDARGAWGKGRPLALKRLREDAAQMEFLTPQDIRISSTIAPSRQAYSSGLRYDIDHEQAALALVGHPHVYWLEAPDTRVELLPGAPELMIRADAGQLRLTLQPALDDINAGVVVVRETPTRLRVVSIEEEHRRIAAIVGDGLSVPLHAEKQVLEAIGAVSSLVTVQSDIGGSAGNAEQVEADTRLHVHLFPYQQGLKMQIQVRPLAGGAYYAPGSGAESMIAEVEGKQVQARRHLAGERDAERVLVSQCPVLEQAEQDHGEWLLGQPALCLQLLSELQELPLEQVVVAWPEGERFRVTQKVGGGQFRLKIRGEKDWFAASGELRVDEGRVMDLRSLLELMQATKDRFVALGDNQFLALTEELHRRLRELQAFGVESADGVRIHPLATFALEELAGEAGAVEADPAWVAHLARLEASTAFTPRLPSTLQAELRDYQRDGYDWLSRLAHWGVGACLADDMGLGKTLQALALILSRAPQGPALVIAPTSVCLNWASEAARFAPTLNVKMFGTGDRAGTLSNAGAFDLVIASYGLLQQDAERFAGVHWHTIVLDEAQAIKNGATKRSQAVMALRGDFRMVATGTPLENHLGELWNLFRFINPGLLGGIEQFNLRFAGPIEKQQDHRAEVGARQRLRRLIGPFILRRTKTQVLKELPSRTEIVLEVDLSQQEKELYESLRREALESLAQVEGPPEKKSIQILAEIMKLRRACCNPNLVAPGLNLASSKLAAFAHLLEGLLENRHKVLVFSQFVDHLTLIRAHLDRNGIAYQYLDGATPMAARKQRVDAFQAGEGDVFLISLKAGGMGINLTAADYVIHMDPWWNPAVEDQASDRAHRMGQLRPVTIYRLVARHTIEEGIVDLHQHKRDLADSLLDGSDMSARMSSQEMLAMLQEGLR
ncbi:DEAD/DEAH box helicase [Pseudoduganella namucuonensis]|uniref:Helicase conserved C-terminal domain-containing protein n=1 Tax=Pseudoduganella namucuonensis TaxID=1035707 RepID=A0A1I7L2V7_9BURK|nr:DEAD/DEAH box helicase [Pseudoduganella namucuonensis]SFV03834.1 Helicase conserved C-terminal domain-containing protein [Pseudoduganella namucuonensis]